MNKYKLPVLIKSSLKRYMSALFVFSTIGMAAVSILIFISLMRVKFIEGLLIGLCSLLMSLFMAYTYIFTSVLKKFCIEMTTEYIKVNLPFKTKMAYWREINDVYLYSHSNNTFVGILLHKDIRKKAKRTISNNFDSLYGVPPTSFQIPLLYFADVDIEKLLTTIDEQVDKNESKDYKSIENSYKDNEEESNSLIKATIASVLISVTTTIVYAFAIYKIKKNFVAIPIFGAFLVISVFNKYYVEKKFSLGIRLLLGILCLIQVPAAIIGSIIFSMGTEVTVNNVIDITLEYFTYLMRNPIEQSAVIIVAIICFAFGTIKGRVR
jgi:hypothetical protein